MILIHVLGTPAPKGSARAFYKAGMKRAVIVKDNDARQKGWDAAVREAAQEAIGAVLSPPYVETALAVEIEFRVSRPGSHWSKKGGLKPSAPSYPSVKPDIDKLARSTLDALIGTAFDDDSRIAKLDLVKVYARPGTEGARIVVRALEQQEEP